MSLECSGCLAIAESHCAQEACSLGIQAEGMVMVVLPWLDCLRGSKFALANAWFRKLKTLVGSLDSRTSADISFDDSVELVQRTLKTPEVNMCIGRRTHA